MEYYVISPNIYNDGDNYADMMYEKSVAAVGWKANDPKGLAFKSIKTGDCIIVAKRTKWKWDYYYLGIVSGEEEKPSYGTISKKLSSIVKLDSYNLGLEKWSANGSTQIPAIQRIDNSKGNNGLIIEIINNIIKMEKYIKLLQTNHNLILTGAPGTGKTYLAKQIAKQIVSKAEKEKPINVLKEAIEKYISDDEEEQMRKNLLDDFLSIYSKEKLQEMSLEDYCIGNSDINNNNFCYWMERRLEPLGRYFPGSSKSYLIYWNKTDEEYKVHGYLKTLSDKPEEIMKTLAIDISNMVVNDDPMSMAKKIGESFILKILSVYYPDEYAPINSRVHINNIISLFGIQCDNDNVFDRNRAIYKFYKEQTQEKKISPWAFMSILYNNFNIKDGEVIQDGVIKKEGDFCIVQFHPSYDYSDFVEGLRPKQDENGNMGFELKNGVFKDLCITAIKNPNKKYVMIIDEINRGEITKIFGELFFSIDPGYRGVEGMVKTQYQNLVEEDDEFFDGFYVPENVYIIGTMNDIDRSVESMDFAFRRRFAFKEVKSKDRLEMLDDLEWKDEAIKRMANINSEIEKIEGLSSAYHIGPAYFLKLKNYNGDFEQLWENHLEGLLHEYMRGMQGVEEKIEKLKAAYDK